MKKVTDRGSIKGQDFQWPLLAAIDTSINAIPPFACGNVMVTISGGKDQFLEGHICGGPPHIAVNFVEGDILIGSGWIEKDFTDAIRIAFNPPVKAAGIQYAINSNINNIEFTAIMRASTDSIKPKDASNNEGITLDVIGDPAIPGHLLGHYDEAAIFLGVKAEGNERIKVIRVDVKPRGLTKSSEILGYYINRLRIEP